MEGFLGLSSAHFGHHQHIWSTERAGDRKRGAGVPAGLAVCAQSVNDAQSACITIHSRRFRRPRLVLRPSSLLGVYDCSQQSLPSCIPGPSELSNPSPSHAAVHLNLVSGGTTFTFLVFL